MRKNVAELESRGFTLDEPTSLPLEEDDDRFGARGGAPRSVQLGLKTNSTKHNKSIISTRNDWRKTQYLWVLDLITKTLPAHVALNRQGFQGTEVKWEKILSKRYILNQSSGDLMVLSSSHGTMRRGGQSSFRGRTDRDPRGNNSWSPSGGARSGGRGGYSGGNSRS